MLLTLFLERFLTDHENGVANSTVECWYKPAVSDLSRHLGHPAEVKDLTRENLNAWVVAKQTAGCSPSTIRTRRNAILSLWRAAFEAEATELEPKRIRKIGRITRCTTAWTVGEIKQLIHHIQNIRENRKLKNKLSYGLFFASLSLAAWDTGLRLGDLLSIEYEWIRVDDEGYGHMTMVQNKVQRPVRVTIDKTTMAMITALMAENPQRRLIWPMWARREQFYRTIRKLVKDAGIRKGTFRWIRRASATAVEMVHPGQSYKHLGHADARVTAVHYIDWTQLPAPARPAPLG